MSLADRSVRTQRPTARLFLVSQAETAAELEKELSDALRALRLAPGFGAGAAAMVETSGGPVKGSSPKTAQAAPLGTMPPPAAPPPGTAPLPAAPPPAAPPPAAPPPAPFDLTLPPGEQPASAPAEAQPASAALTRAALARAAAAPARAAGSEEEALGAKDGAVSVPNIVAPARR
jgi:hypothetical protein